MVFEETTQEYTDRVLECIAEIRGIDPSQVPTDECIATQVRTFEDLLERLNAYTRVNETKDSTKPNASAVLEDNISVANFAARGCSNSFKENQSRRNSNGRAVNENSRPIQENRKCFICD